MNRWVITLSRAACQWCTMSTSAWVVQTPVQSAELLGSSLSATASRIQPPTITFRCLLIVDNGYHRDWSQITVNERRWINFRQNQNIGHLPDIRHVNFLLQISRKLPWIGHMSNVQCMYGHTCPMYSACTDTCQHKWPRMKSPSAQTHHFWPV